LDRAERALQARTRMSTLDHHAGFLPFAPGATPGFAVTHLTQAHWSVRIWGTLGPFWADAFSLGLSDAGISIRRGFARQDGAARWIADFVLSPGVASPAPSTLDFLALASRPLAACEGGPIVLTHYALDGGPDVGPSLYLEVRGPDRVGFLGSLLHALVSLDLSPCEMLISTRDGEAFDRFFLKTTKGAVPSQEARHRLEAVLEAALLDTARIAIA
jgi:hypothetical protein